MASSNHMVSTILPEKSSGSLAFISVGLVVVPSMLFKGCWAGAKCSSLVILMLGSGMEVVVGSGRVEMEMGRGSSAADDSCHGRIFGFLQTLYILLSSLSPDGLPVPC